MKRILTTLATLALALAIPASALAVDATGSTAETFSIPASISATFPAGPIAYTGTSGTLTSGPVIITGITTNASTWNVSMKASALTGPQTIATTARSRSAVTRTGACGTYNTAAWGQARAAGFYATATTSDGLIADTSGACASGDFPVAVSFTMGLDVGAAPKPGTYSGTLSFTATAP